MAQVSKAWSVADTPITLSDGHGYGFTPGENADAAFVAAIAALADTGGTIKLKPGIYIITTHYEIQGWTLDLSAGAEINCSGSVDTNFPDGFLEILANGRLIGGTVYTSGAMGGTSGVSASSSCAVLVNGGEIDGTIVYSQMNSAVKHYSGKVRCKTIGGRWHGFLSYLTADPGDTEYHVDTYNSGVQYIAKAVQASGNTSASVRACHIYFTADITSQVVVDYQGKYSGSSLLWITGEVDGSGFPLYDMSDLHVFHPIADYAGTYITSGGSATGGSSATGIEIIGCPDARISNPYVRDPQGYAVALATYSHRSTLDGGFSQCVGDDPGVVVYYSDDCVVRNHTVKQATVGFSVGEDVGHADNAMIIGCTAIQCSYGAVRFDVDANGRKITVDKMTAINCGESSGYAGNFTGPGELLDVMRVYGSITPVFDPDETIVNFTNSTIIGANTELVRAYETGNSVKLFARGNTYRCPYIPPTNDTAFRAFGVFDRAISGVDYYPMIAADTGGRAGTGITTINNATAGASVVLDMTDVTPYIGTKAANLTTAGEWVVLVYIQKNADMNGNIQFGISDAANTAHTPRIAYTSSIFSADSVISDYQNGEWIPLAMSLTGLMYSGIVDWAAVTHFNILKAGYAPNYELIVTKPVLMMGRVI